VRFFVTVLAALSLTACGSDAGAPSGGIQGVVTAGPTCPVEMEGSSCPPQVWTGTVRATAEDATQHETLTDGAGAYSLQLEPGIYTVEPVVQDAGPVVAKPVTVTVGGQVQTVDLQVDTGIR
jgi:hypothetical protein